MDGGSEEDTGHTCELLRYRLSFPVHNLNTAEKEEEECLAINLMVIFLPLTFAGLVLNTHNSWINTEKEKREFLKYLPTPIITRNKLQIELENNLAQHSTTTHNPIIISVDPLWLEIYDRP